jgi:hypothetical protein
MSTPLAASPAAEWSSWLAGAQLLLMAQHEEIEALRLENEALRSQLTALASELTSLWERSGRS